MEKEKEKKGGKAANETEPDKGECHLLLPVPGLMIPVWLPGCPPPEWFL